MNDHNENSFSQRLLTIALSWRLVLGLVLGSVFMAIGSLYTVAAMAVARRGASSKLAGHARSAT